MTEETLGLSVLIPACNEAATIGKVIEATRQALEQIPCSSEILVIDDASKDSTRDEVRHFDEVTLVANPVRLGYGHSLLRGIGAARGDLIAIIDADGTYDAASFPDLYRLIERGADHAIGRRTGRHFLKLFSSRHLYRWLCAFVVGSRVPDANSGIRIFRRSLVHDLRVDLCLGFSFTTSLTLASIMSGYLVAFSPVPYYRRQGRSHVRLRDVLRTAQYLFQLVAVYNPLKVFLPLLLVGGTAALGSLIVWWRLREPVWLGAGLVMFATSLLLAGLATMTFVISRTGLRPAPLRPVSGAKPPQDRVSL